MNNFAQIFHTAVKTEEITTPHVVVCKVSHWAIDTIFNPLTFFITKL